MSKVIKLYKDNKQEDEASFVQYMLDNKKLISFTELD